MHGAHSHTFPVLCIGYGSVTYETLPKIWGEGTELRAGVIVRITKSG